MNLCSQQAWSWRSSHVLTALLLIASLRVSDAASATDITACVSNGGAASFTKQHQSTVTFTCADLSGVATRVFAFAAAGTTCNNLADAALANGGGVSTAIYSSAWTSITPASFNGGGSTTDETFTITLGDANSAVGAAVATLCIADDNSGTNGQEVTACNSVGLVAASANNAVTAFSFSPSPATTADTVAYTYTSGAAGAVSFQATCTNAIASGNRFAVTATTATVNLQISNAALYQVCYTVTGGTDATQQVISTVAQTVNIGPILVFGDPVAYYGDKRQINFWLPLGMMMPLLRTPDLDIFGSTYQGLVGKKGQYFNRFVVASEGGLMVDAKVRKSSLSADAPPDPSVALQPTDTFEDLKTMDVDFVEGVMRGTVGHDDGWTQVQALTGQKGSELPSEAIEVVSKSIHFTLNSCFLIHTKFGGWAPHYSHMSLQVVSLPDAHDNYTGIFPELWGMQPMSKCTEALTNMEGEPHSLPNECYKWEAYAKHPGMQLADSEQLPSVEL